MRRIGCDFDSRDGLAAEAAVPDNAHRNTHQLGLKTGKVCETDGQVSRIYALIIFYLSF